MDPDVIAARDYMVENWQGTEGVIGIGIAGNHVRIYCERGNIPEGIPEEVEGMQVDVISTTLEELEERA